MSGANLPEDAHILSGSYTGNGLADGRFVYTGCALETLTVGGNTYDNDGTDSGVVVFLATGFKLTSTTDNTNAVNYNWTGTLRYPAKTANAQVN